MCSKTSTFRQSQWKMSFLSYIHCHVPLCPLLPFHRLAVCHLDHAPPNHTPERVSWLSDDMILSWSENTQQSISQTTSHRLNTECVCVHGFVVVKLVLWFIIEDAFFYHTVAQSRHVEVSLWHRSCFYRGKLDYSDLFLLPCQTLDSVFEFYTWILHCCIIWIREARSYIMSIHVQPSD